MSQTKYEILKSYKDAGKPNLIRDTWKNLGGAIAGPDSRTFIKDMIYLVQLDDITAELDGSLILCESSLYSASPLEWAEAISENDEEGYFSFASGVISPHFRVLLTREEVNSITAPEDPTFVPYYEVNTSDVIIPDEELELILTEVGVPFVLMEELEFPRDKILNNMIKPAMQKYFKYFPIIKQATVMPVGLSNRMFEIEVPEGAYGATRAFIAQGLMNSTGDGSAGNPLFWAANGNGNNGSMYGTFGGRRNGIPGYANLQGFTTVALDRAARQGMMNYATRVHFNIERRGKKKYLIGSSTKMGMVEVHWAYASNNWADIEFARLDEVRGLATAYVMRALGMLRGQVKSDLPGQLDFSNFITRANELEKETVEFWKSIPKGGPIRG